MAEGEHDGGDGTRSEEGLQRTLTALEPLLRRRAQVGAPDPAFVQALRQRLLAMETETSNCVVGRARPARFRGALGGRERHPRPRRWAVVAIAVALAVLVVLVLASLALVWLDLAVAMVMAVLIIVAVGRRRR
jgi:Flp pilus assembly protein TadB